MTRRPPILLALSLLATTSVPPVVLARATPTIVQISAAVATGNDPAPTLPGASTSGNTLFILVWGDLTRTVSSIADDGSNTWGNESNALREVESDGGATSIDIWYANNITASATPDATVTMSGAGDNRAFMIEVSGLSDTAPFDQVGSFDDATNRTDWECAPSAINTAVEVYVVCIAEAVASIAGSTPGSGYTEIVDSTIYFAQHRVSAGALSSEKGAFTAGESRNGHALLASFKAGAAAATPCYRLLLGVGCD